MSLAWCKCRDKVYHKMSTALAETEKTTILWATLFLLTACSAVLYLSRCSWYGIPHLIGLNDVLISAMLLHRVAPLCSLTMLIHDRELKRQPCRFVWHGKHLAVVPDAFLVIQVILTDGRKLDIAVLIEHDNGNEFGERFRNKLHAIHAMLQAEAYKERFGVEYVTVAFTTF